SNYETDCEASQSQQEGLRRNRPLREVCRVDNLNAAALWLLRRVSADYYLLLLGQQLVVVTFLALVRAIVWLLSAFRIRDFVYPLVEIPNLLICLIQKLLCPLGVALHHRDLRSQAKNARVAQLLQLLFSLVDSIFPIGNHLILVALHRVKLLLLRNDVG